MPDSNRRSNTSFGIGDVLYGWVVALALALVLSVDLIAYLVVPQNFDADEKRCRSDYQQADAQRKAAPGNSQPAPKATDDADPDKHAREYCVQRRGAIAAERQADFARGGLYLGFATLFAAVAAALGALLAARRARQTVETMQDTAKRELRARLSALPGGINQLIGESNGMGHVTLRNVGKLPARNVSLWVDMMLSDLRETQFPIPDDTERPARVVQVETEMRQGSVTTMHLFDLRTTRRYIFVWGVAYYDDGYGSRRFTRFCHRYAVQAHNSDLDWEAQATRTRSLIDADKARYHPNGNDAD
jgi:hypothetical protein